MDLKIDINTGEFLEINPSDILLKNGDTTIISVQFVDDCEVVEVDDSATVQFALKKKDDFSGSYIAYASSWTKVGSLPDTKYEIEVSLNTTQLNDALNGEKKIPVSIELEWIEGTEVSSTMCQYGYVENDLIKTGTLPPDDIPNYPPSNVITDHINNTSNPHSVTATQVGALQSGDNISELVNDAGYLTSATAAPVDSVNGQTGVVVLGASDVGAATTTQGATADTALQPGANVSELVNDAGYLTSTTAAPVDSVNGQTGVVVLDAPDVNAATTAQGNTADSALQPGANVSELVNDSGYITDAGVTQITAGSNITINPVGGTGVVEISSTGGGGGGGAVDSVNGQTGVVVLDASDVGAATAAQGSTADTALQSGDNISELTNDAGYVTSSGIENVVEDTTPELGGDLDVNGNEIVSSSDGDIVIAPDGAGKATFKGGGVGGNGAGRIKLNCENNSHGITIEGPPHSAAANYTLTLPDDLGSNGEVLTTDGAGVTSWTTPATGGTDYTAVVHKESVDGSTITAVDGEWYIIDPDGGDVTITPPATGKFRITDSAGNAATNDIIVDFITASINLHGVSDNYTLNLPFSSTEFEYVDVTLGYITTGY